jgi:hypothetical protein
MKKIKLLIWLLFSTLIVSGQIMPPQFRYVFTSPLSATSNTVSLSGTYTSTEVTLDTLQVNHAVRVGTSTISPSSLMELSSTTRGLLIPRMTTAQRDAISAPATGLQIYNTSTSAFNYYTGAAWTTIGSNIASANLTANASYTTTFTGYGWTLKGGTFTREGSGATSETTTALFQNSSGTLGWKLKNDGRQDWFVNGGDNCELINIGGYKFIQNGFLAKANLAVGSNNTLLESTYYQALFGTQNTSGASGSSILGTYNTVATSGNQAIVLGYQNNTLGQANVIRVGQGAASQNFGGNRSMHFGQFSGAAVADLTADEIVQFYFGDRTAAVVGRGNGTWGLIEDGSYALSYVYDNTSANNQLGTGGNTLVVANHTSNPSTNLTDKFQLYSKDIVVGNACPHIRTENGDIIKLFANDNTVTPAILTGGGGTTITDTDTFGGFTLQEVVAALIANGLLK